MQGHRYNAFFVLSCDAQQYHYIPSPCDLRKIRTTSLWFETRCGYLRSPLAVASSIMQVQFLVFAAKILPFESSANDDGCLPS